MRIFERFNNLYWNEGELIGGSKLRESLMSAAAGVGLYSDTVVVRGIYLIGRICSLRNKKWVYLKPKEMSVYFWLGGDSGEARYNEKLANKLVKKVDHLDNSLSLPIRAWADFKHPFDSSLRRDVSVYGLYVNEDFGIMRDKWRSGV
jgi:hypothetical protein